MFVMVLAQPANRIINGNRIKAFFHIANRAWHDRSGLVKVDLNAAGALFFGLTGPANAG